MTKLILPNEIDADETARARELLKQAMAMSTYRGSDYQYGMVTAQISYIVSYNAETDAKPTTINLSRIGQVGGNPIFGDEAILGRRKVHKIGGERNLIRGNSFILQRHDIIPAYPALRDFLGWWMDNLDGKIVDVKIAGAPFMKFNEVKGSLEDHRN